MAVKVKELQKQVKRKPLWMIYLMLTMAAITLAICTQYFTIEAQIYTPGFGGFSSGISYVITDIVKPENVKTMQVMIYWIFYIMFNIPVLYLMWGWYGEKFWFRTIYVFTLNFLVTMLLTNFAGGIEIIPPVEDQASAIGVIRIIILGAMGGGLFGLAVGIALSHGGSTAGFDPISKYLAREKGINLSTILFLLGVITSVTFIGIRSFTNDAMTGEIALSQIVSSLVFLTIYSAVAGILYSTTKKLEIAVTSKKISGLSDHFNKINYHRSHTISNVQGGYSKEEYQMLKMIINTEELPDVIEDIVEIDPNAFITIKELSEIFDLHDWTPKTKYDKQLDAKKAKKKKDREKKKGK